MQRKLANFVQIAFVQKNNSFDIDTDHERLDKYNAPLLTHAPGLYKLDLWPILFDLKRLLITAYPIKSLGSSNLISFLQFLYS